MDGKVGVYFILHHYPSLPHSKGYLPADNSLRYSPLVQTQYKKIGCTNNAFGLNLLCCYSEYLNEAVIWIRLFPITYPGPW